MKLKLYGSLTSPFVRRIRALLQWKETPFTMEVINIYQSPGREILKSISPVLKIPVIEIDGQALFDSRVIFNYLQMKGLHRDLSIAEENALTIVDAVADSLVALFLLKRTNLTVTPEMAPYGVGQFERITMSLQHLEKSISQKEQCWQEWSYLGIALCTTLEWAIFRKMYDFSPYPALLKYVADHTHRPEMKQTFPQE